MDLQEFLKDIHFPFDSVRKHQFELIGTIHAALKNKQHALIHAPTGIGKTASVLAPALKHAQENDLTIFFLTSRHMQHQIVIKTLKAIKQKHDLNITVTDIIGKRGMCLQPGATLLKSGDFHSYCKKLREDMQCEFYVKTRQLNNSPTKSAKKVLESIEKKSPATVEDVIEIAKLNNMCPYELGVLSGKKARVVIADYYYIFSDAIRHGFLSKIGKSLDECIIIIDEGHNLPSRVRELLTHKLSSFVLDRAQKEAQKMKRDIALENLEIIQNAFENLTDSLLKTGKPETLIKKHELIDAISDHKDYDLLIDELESEGELILEESQQSFVLSVAKFLTAWMSDGNGFTRILTIEPKNNNISLLLKCLDPSVVTKDIIDRSHTTLLMSGTLTPTSMFKDILGFPDNTIQKEFDSPFTDQNRRVLVVPKTTTKYSARSDEQFTEIATTCADLCSNIQGSAIIFFPSYFLLNTIGERFKSLYHKTIFMEKPRLSKAEKEDFIANFKSYKDTGAILLAVSNGSFGEGLDLPGILKGVIVVGLPLNRPDLQTQELIAYYDSKFGKGWDYGYTMPALTTCLQNAGRCIRSETDKGVLIFLDQRYAWNNYLKCFPKDWNVKIDHDYEKHISEFFQK